MKIKVTFEIGKDENQWLELHNKCKGSRQDWEQFIRGTVYGALESLQLDYDQHLEAEEMKAAGGDFYDYSQFLRETSKDKKESKPNDAR